MQIVLTLDDSINFIEAVGMAEAFEAGGEYPWCKRADVRSFACGERTPEETGSASLQPTTPQSTKKGACGCGSTKYGADHLP